MTTTTQDPQTSQEISKLRQECDNRKRFDDAVIQAEEACRIAETELANALNNAKQKRKALAEADAHLKKIIRNGGPEPNLFEHGAGEDRLVDIGVPDAVKSILREHGLDDVNTLAVWLEAGNELEGLGIDSAHSRVIIERVNELVEGNAEDPS